MLTGFGSLHTRIAKMKAESDERKYSIFRAEIAEISTLADRLKEDAEFVLAALEPPVPVESEKIAEPEVELSTEGTAQEKGQTTTAEPQGGDAKTEVQST